MRKSWLLFFFAILIPLAVRAAVSVDVNGSSYTIPQTNEKGWGTNVTAWIQAISANTLHPDGGTFTLTADANFGGSYGIVAPYLKSSTSTIADAGTLRMAVSDDIAWRNNANDGNLLLSVDGSDNLTFNGAIVNTATSGSFQDSTFSLYDNGDATKLLKFELSGITTGNTRTITIPDASTTLVGTDATQTLTNKTLTSPVISTISNTGTVTLPTATTTLVGRDTTDTLTNKTISGSSNTISNISLTAAVTGTLPVANGGTNSTTALNNNRVMVSSSGAIVEATAITGSRALVSDANGIPTAAATTATEIGYVSGVTSAIQDQIDAITGSASASYDILNCSLATSVAANALTIALKDSSGSDPSGGSACKIGFRDSTATTGTYNQRSVTSALSLTISSGSTLGCASALECDLYVYALDNAGTVELAVSSTYWTDDLQSTSAEGGAGAADSAVALYSSSARSSKPVRLLGVIYITEATAGTWASNATSIRIQPLSIELGPKMWAAIYYSAASGCTVTTTSGTVAELADDSDCTSRGSFGNASFVSNRMDKMRVSKIKPGRYSLTYRMNVTATGSAGTSCEFYVQADDGAMPTLYAQAAQYGSTMDGAPEASSFNIAWSETVYYETVDYYMTWRRGAGAGTCAAYTDGLGAVGWSQTLLYWPLVNGS